MRITTCNKYITNSRTNYFCIKVQEHTSHHVKETHDFQTSKDKSKTIPQTFQAFPSSRWITPPSTSSRIFTVFLLQTHVIGSIQSPRLNTPPVPNFTLLASSHPHNKVVVSDIIRVFLAPPLQTDVEYYYHRLFRLTLCNPDCINTSLTWFSISQTWFFHQFSLAQISQRNSLLLNQTKKLWY